jgi:WD40 repeat protein
MIAAVGEDGALNVWRTGEKAKYARADYTNEKAHEAGSWTGSLAWSKDGKSFVTRGGDGTLKRALYFLEFPCSRSLVIPPPDSSSLSLEPPY